MPDAGGDRTGFGLQPRASSRSRLGSVLVLATVLVAVLALIATAFMISAQTASQASINSLRGMQAEAACRTGLAAAIYQIEVSYTLGSAVSLYDSSGIGDAWHREFYDAAITDVEDLCPDAWAKHYDAPFHMRGSFFLLPRIWSGDPCSNGVKELKRTRGYAAKYYVAVADLDGKLRVNPKGWATLINGDDAKLRAMLRCCLSTDGLADRVRDYTHDIWSIGAMRLAFNPISATEQQEVESFLTPYPRQLAEPRPPVNVNTARREVLKAIVLNVPGLNVDDGTGSGKAYADRVADKLVAKRPFADRRDMEEALAELGDPVWPAVAGYTFADKILTEWQLNDLLNSLAGINADAESDLDDAGTPGYYHYDFNGDTNANERTSDTPSATWGTEVKFNSRFFHVYVLGRTYAEDGSERTLAQRRLHAVYDAGERKVLWCRWNFERRANAGE